jgi:hypothetical protein
MSRSAPPSTKTPFEIHTDCCRDRSKRKRLSSNDPIESDAAFGISHAPGVSRRVTSDRVLTFYYLAVRAEWAERLHVLRRTSVITSREDW